MLLRRGVSFGAGAGSASQDGADLSSQPAKWALRVVPPMPASIKCRCGEVTVTFAEAAPRQSLLCCCVDCVRRHEQSLYSEPIVPGTAAEGPRH